MSIKCKCSDDNVITIDLKLAKLSGTLNGMLQYFDDVNIQKDDPDDIPKLPVKSEILNKVFEWVAHHCDDPPPPPEEDEFQQRRTDNIPEWDKTFLNVELNMLVDLIAAADYLDIPSLETVCCKTIANLIKRSTPSKITTVFGLTCDFSPEEREILLEKSVWEDFD